MSMRLIRQRTPQSLHRRESEEGRCIAKVQTLGLASDIVVMIRPRDLFRPVVYREVLEERGTEALMLSLVPNFDSSAGALEAIFVLDCSGSMKGPRIQQAKSATHIFLRSLPADARFNIVLFGSTFTAFSSSGSVPYSEASLQAAAAYVDAIEATLGGTDILAPLRSLLEDAPLVRGASREVFLLTDGQVSNQQEVINLARSNSSRSRIFSVGIGSGVSSSLVNGVARASHGFAAFVQDMENLEPVCVSMLRKAMRPGVSGVAISWPAVPSFRSQTRPPPMFSGEGFSAVTLYPHGALPDDAVVTVTGETCDGKIEWEVPVPSSWKAKSSGRDATLHQMFARRVIAAVEGRQRERYALPPFRNVLLVPSDSSEAEETWQPEAVQLSVLYSVLCLFTAFVAVERAADCHVERTITVAKLGRQQRIRFEDCAASLGECVQRAAHLELSSATFARRPLSSRRLIWQRMQGSPPPCIARSCALEKPRSCKSRPARAWCLRRAAADTIRGLGSGIATLLSCALKLAGFQHAGATSSVPIPQAGGQLQESAHASCATDDGQAEASPPTNPSTIAAIPAAAARSGGEAARNRNFSGLPRLAQLETLLRLASFKGSFTISAQLRDVTGIDEQWATSWAQDTWGRPVDRDVLATALVLCHLALQFQAEAATWELVGSKAKQWLQAQEHEWRCEKIGSMDALLAHGTSRMHPDALSSKGSVESRSARVSCQG